MTYDVLGVAALLAVVVGTILFWVVVVKAVIDYAAKRFAEERRRR